MAIAGDGGLHVYFLNVGQGDTTVIVSPQGHITLIDASRPKKLQQFLADLGLPKRALVDLMVITHPHSDHYLGAGRVLQNYRVMHAVLCPFWHAFGIGPPGYQRLVMDLYNHGTSCQFLSGYARFYTDIVGAAVAPAIDMAQQFRIDLLGPANALVKALEDQQLFNANHLSIMARLSWNSQHVVIAADAQMENWAFFDSERLVGEGCDILRAAHHGSANGTQWERLSRLAPKVVVVSSDLSAGHRLPDVNGAAAFARYAIRQKPRPLVALTGEAGTVEVEIDAAGHRAIYHYEDGDDDDIDLTNRQPLTLASNPTDWRQVLFFKAFAI
jgi:competence protein ComEC